MIRIGINVGGTFTKAVAVDRESGHLLAHVAVPTAHRAEHGVAEGAILALKELLSELGQRFPPIGAITLSTTQAVNALLEGDVVPVGILAFGPRRQRKETQRRTHPASIQLAPGRVLPLKYAYLDFEETDDQAITARLEDLRARGVGAVALSAAYAVEDPQLEQRALRIAQKLDLPATAGHQLTGLYGLEVRTITAAINASILPRMRETTQWIRAALAETDLTAPSMVLAGDLSMVPLDQLATLPATSILSGPAASVAGALRLHHTLDALFVEMGGTSTNIGVIRNGRSAFRYVRIMHHPTCLRSVDVHVVGIGGGSLIRVQRDRIVGVGPRSAHIAGLQYASFAPRVVPAFTVETSAPIAGDNADYVVIRNSLGQTIGLTLTDAANVLGLLAEGDYARGNREQAYRVFSVLSEQLGCSPEDVAREVLRQAVAILVPILREMIGEYELRNPQLIGLGGGAGVITPLLSQELGLEGFVAHHAAVMASIGDATAPLNIIEDIQANSGQSLLEAVERLERRLVSMGASKPSIQVVVEPIPERQAFRLRATAFNSSVEPTAHDGINRESAQKIAAEALGVPEESVQLSFENMFFRVFTAQLSAGFWPFRRDRRGVVVIDRLGSICFRTENGWYLACQNLSELDRIPQPSCICAIVGARCLFFERTVPREVVSTGSQPICLLVGQPI